MGTAQSKGGSKAGGKNSDIEFNWVSDPSGSQTLKIYLPGFSQGQIKVQHDKGRGVIMIDGKRPAVTYIHFREEFPITEHLGDQIQAVLKEEVLLVTFKGTTKTPLAAKDAGNGTAEIMVQQGRATSQEGVIHVTIQATMPQTIPSIQQPSPPQKPETQTENNDVEKKKKEVVSVNAQQTEQEAQSKGTSKAGGDATDRANSDVSYKKFRPHFDWIKGPSGSKTLKIHVPGFSQGQIKVQHDKRRGVIMIDGKCRKVENLHVRKEFPIPETPSDQIQAVFEEGVLLVTFSATKTPSDEIQEGVIHANIQITMPQTIPSSQRPSPAPSQKPETQPTQKDDEEKKRKEFESGNAQQTEQEPRPPSIETHAGKVTSDREEKDSPTAAMTLAPVAAEMVLQSRATYQEGVIHANIQITMPQTIPSSQRPSPAPSQKPETQPTQKDDEEKKRKEFESVNAQQTEQEPKSPSLETHAGKVTSDREEKGSPAAAVTLAPVAAEMVLQSRATYQEGVIHANIQITMPQTIPSSQRPSPAPSQKLETQLLKRTMRRKTVMPNCWI